MVRNMYSLLKPGGRVAGLGSSCKVPAECLKKEEKYGRFYETDDNYFKKNGTKYTVRIVDEEADLDISLVLYWYSEKYYEDVFKKVGFTDFTWVPMHMEGDERNADYWKDFLEDNTLMMYQAFKPK
jgi:hypothetical protein